MAKRISYFKNLTGKSLKELFIEHYPDFRNWALDYHKEVLQLYNEPLVEAFLIDFMEEFQSIQDKFDYLDKEVIDKLTAEFICEYMRDDAPGEYLLEFFGPTMSTWRYEKSTQMVLNAKNQEFIDLWSYVINGRSLKDNLKFESNTHGFAIGFLSFDEQQQLKKYIEYYFGTIEQLEKKNNSFWASDRPKRAGLEYVLDALNEIQNEGVELVIEVEF